MRLAATVENYKRKNVENKKAYEGTDRENDYPIYRNTLEGSHLKTLK